MRRNIVLFFIILCISIMMFSGVSYASDQRYDQYYEIESFANSIAELQTMYYNSMLDSKALSVNFRSLVRYISDEHECSPWSDKGIWETKLIAKDSKDTITVTWICKLDGNILGFAYGDYDSDSGKFINVHHYNLISKWE